MFRGKAWNAGKLQGLFVGERIPDLDGTVIVDPDDVPRIGFFHVGAILGHQDGGVGDSDLFADAVVQDLDVLREALGQEQLDYLGLSYGTLIGALYAEEYPDKVGRMVLDGVLPPDLS